jgi:hypothetical protein
MLKKQIQSRTTKMSLKSDLSGKGYLRFTIRHVDENMVFAYNGSRQTWPYLAGLLILIGLGQVAFGSPSAFLSFVNEQSWGLLLVIYPALALFLVFLVLTISWFAIRHHLLLSREMKPGTLRLRSSWLGMPWRPARQVRVTRCAIIEFVSPGSRKKTDPQGEFVFVARIGGFQLPGMAVFLGDSKETAREFRKELTRLVQAKVRWRQHISSKL